jgi:tetratricopeptide (TPR) repeat protein
MVVARRQQGQDTRYQLLETIRQFALEKLESAGLRNKMRDRHLAYFVQFGKQAEEKLVGPDQVVWLKCVERELDNIRAALRWACETDLESGLQLGTALSQFWAGSYTREGENWLSQLLVQADRVEPVIKAKALWMQSRLNFFYLLNNDHARVLVDESLALYRKLGDQQGIGRCLYLLGWGSETSDQSLLLESLAVFKAIGDKLGLAEVLGTLGFRISVSDYRQFNTYLDESESLYRELGHLAGIAESLDLRGEVSVRQGDFEVARPILEESLILRESLGLRGSDWTLFVLGKLYFWLGEYEQARSYFEKSLSISHQSGAKFNYIWTLVHLGYVFLRMGELDQARMIFVRCQQLFKVVYRGISGVVFSIEGLASLALSQGQAPKAARLFGWADATRKSTQDTRPPVEQAKVEDDIATILETIGEEIYAMDYAEGQAMTMDEAIAYAKGNE